MLAAASVGVHLLDDGICLPHLFLERLPPGLHVAVKAQNLPVDGEALLNALVDDGQDPLDRGTVVSLFGFVAFHLLHHGRGIRQMQAGVYSLSKFEQRALDGLVHLLRLPAGAAEDDDPAILTQFLAERLGVLLQFLVAGIQAVLPHIEFVASSRERSFGPRLEYG